MLTHGSVVRPTMYLASMEIKTAFDEARPWHVAKIMEGHNTHGWIISALLREMVDLETRHVRVRGEQVLFRSTSLPGKR